LCSYIVDLLRVDHDKKIKSRKQKTDIVIYSFLNKTIQFWNQLPTDALESLFCKPSNFRKRARNVINKVKGRCGGNHKKNAVKLSGVKFDEVKGSKLC
jgi:hypothetical protein